MTSGVVSERQRSFRANTATHVAISQPPTATLRNLARLLNSVCRALSKKNRDGRHGVPRAESRGSEAPVVRAIGRLPGVPGRCRRGSGARSDQMSGVLPHAEPLPSRAVANNGRRPARLHGLADDHPQQALARLETHCREWPCLSGAVQVLSGVRRQPLPRRVSIRRTQRPPSWARRARRALALGQPRAACQAMVGDCAHRVAGCSASELDRFRSTRRGPGDAGFAARSQPKFALRT